jgi:hypothetical protein
VTGGAPTRIDLRVAITAGPASTSHLAAMR